MFVAFVDARPQEPDEGRAPWEPNWRLWSWLAAALVVGFAAGHADGGVQYLLILVVVALVCRAIDEVLPSMRGLKDWRQ